MTVIGSLPASSPAPGGPAPGGRSGTAPTQPGMDSGGFSAAFDQVADESVFAGIAQSGGETARPEIRVVRGPAADGAEAKPGPARIVRTAQKLAFLDVGNAGDDPEPAEPLPEVLSDVAKPATTGLTGAAKVPVDVPPPARRPRLHESQDPPLASLDMPARIDATVVVQPAPTAIGLKENAAPGDDQPTPVDTPASSRAGPADPPNNTAIPVAVPSVNSESAIKVSVSAVETHFSPAMSAAAIAKVSDGSDGSDEAEPQPAADGGALPLRSKMASPAEVNAPVRETVHPHANPGAYRAAVETDGTAAAAGDSATPLNAAGGLPSGQLQRIAETVANAAGALAAQSPAPGAIAFSSVAAGGDAPTPVRVLTLALDPPEYGNLTMRLSVRAGNLSVHLSGGSDETTRLLAHDRERLTSLLKSSGIDADVSIGQAISPTPTPGPASAPTQGGGASIPYADAGGSGQGRAPREGRDDAPASRQQNRSLDDPNVENRRSGALYV